MKKLVLIFSFLSILIFYGQSNAEVCPNLAQMKAIYGLSVSDFLPDGPRAGKMPYPVNIPDPYYEERDGKWFVVSRIFNSLRDPNATPFVAFVVFDGPSTLTTAQALAQAKTIVDTQANETSTSVDYPNFVIGEDPDNPNIIYKFDVCLFAGTFDVPTGTEETTQENWSTYPIVMADLSPNITAASLKADLKALIKQVNQVQDKIHRLHVESK